EGDAAITTPLTFAATSNAVLYCRARPLFADIRDDTWTLDPEAVTTVAEAAGEKVRGLLPVHFAGLPADAERLVDLAHQRGWWVIEDACHALGARWRDGRGRWREVGDSPADATVLSFHPVKPITTGEGGAVLTGREDVARRVRELRHHGIVRDPAHLERRGPGWYHEMQHLGFNYRVTDIQCALGRVQLSRLPGFVERRRRLAALYRERLEGDRRIRLQAEVPEARSAWHLLAVRVPHRDRVYDLLRARRIGAQVHYPLVSSHPYYRRLGHTPESCPVAARHAAGTLSLPLYPDLTDAQVGRVCDALIHALDTAETAGGGS
ncbi:MAG: DegT/DnrJ/EryC1/StrS family aminotransferase, partial [Acidobacteriota bacterium]|nr:DegT/DnrJ/EryC1/StrS family aminotransferase [Acidobacteriota bacterium]